MQQTVHLDIDRPREEAVALLDDPDSLPKGRSVDDSPLFHSPSRRLRPLLGRELLRVAMATPPDPLPRRNPVRRECERLS
jgi:hypothetical protein